MESSHRVDYSFEDAPTAWEVRAGAWQGTHRWACVPRWSFFGGRGKRGGPGVAHGSATLWNRRLLQGDFDVELFVAPMEATPQSQALRENYERHAAARDFQVGEAPLQGGGSDANLLAARSSLESKALRNIIEISLLRYAQILAPSAFGDYLLENPDSTFSINRLPASNDPMVGRIERIRGVEYVFTDAVDAKFRELSADVETVYDLWREYRRKFNQFKREESLRVQTSQSDAQRGSYEAILERYEHYKWDRQADEEQEKWAVGFENEMGPTITAIEERVEELEGWVEERYSEWQRILDELFELETELPA